MNNLEASNPRLAVYDLLKHYLTPALDGEFIYWGNQNNISLPASTQDYVIFNLLSVERHGTNKSLYDAEGETESHDVEYEYMFQIDCYSLVDGSHDGITAMQRAQSIEILSRGGQAQALMEDDGFHLLYCDPPQDTTITTDDNTYVRRVTATLHIASHTVLSMDMEGFTSVDVVPNLVTTKQQAQEQDPADNRLGVSNVDVKFNVNGDM